MVEPVFDSPAAWHLRNAQPDDVRGLLTLIGRSGVELSAGFYTPEQAQAITLEVFGVDSQLIVGQSYYLVEQQGVPVACGGWSQRLTVFGGDQTKTCADPLLNPATDAARIRAFFVVPEMARRGLGSLLMRHCMEQAAQAGFRSLELAATLPGVPLYRAFGFAELQAFEVQLSGGIRVPLVRMGRALGDG